MNFKYINEHHTPTSPKKTWNELKKTQENEKSHGGHVYIVKVYHHVVHRENNVIHAKHRDQNEDRFSQAPGKPRQE